MRFGYVANDVQIEAYVDRLDFHHDAVFGVFNRKLQIVALAHLAICRLPGSEPVGDFGVSVFPAWRGRGLGGRLYERAALHARNEGVEVLQIQALASNVPMLAIARKHGATVQRMGSESEACLRLAKPSLESRLQEILEEYWAHLHYTAKAQARAWSDWLAIFQSIRQRAISATTICSP
ncbi:GNAT family N-acetyltransferase [Rhodoferax bucti]|uniref:GNAT family N-acetyltransferase n=1 Tax=Rhodoferax bucti TaxID=2576305 RepID=UPI001F0E8021|nr:GNAT family N-acetyltransferase [Rhodoferax bucti]